ncbi:hypothetical protein HJC23_011772 [Cyclotella cryptica]|uniref:Methyltransferase FkbM domain-containing protein n=1 Tax=Cyclotella cryptica TaxID=29204 RepID=A0ABD3PG61_9STRA|eukprot:CCRYP_014812-RA/>CCRYP_014812-RA protein AED:0.36 eAED:0.36 QI:437/1/1/1/0/0/2/168/282
MRSRMFTRSMISLLFAITSLCSFWFQLSAFSSSTNKKDQVKHSMMDLRNDLGNKDQNNTQSTRNIFIDLGANCGNSYKRLLKANQLNREGNWEVYLWEANPQLIEFYLNDIQSDELVPKNHVVDVIEAAAAASDGFVSFYLTAGQELINDKSQFPDKGRCDPDSVANPSGASSLLSNKKRAGKPIEVKAIDFARWMNDDLKALEDDYLMIKIDIEGAELQLLDRLMEVIPMGFCHVNKLFIEWHAFKFRDNETITEHTNYANNFTSKYAQVCGHHIELAAWH